MWLENRPPMFVPTQQNKKSKTAALTSKKVDVPFVVTPSSGVVNTKDPLEKQLEKQNILDILGRELLSKLFDKEALKNIVDIFKSSLTVDEVLDCVATTHNQVREERRFMLQRKKEALLHATQPQQLNVLPSRYPFMVSHGIDVTNSDVVSRLLRAVSTMQKEVVSKGGVDIFQFMQGNDKSTTLIRIHKNKTRKHFEHNLTCNNKGYNFVYRLLDAMLPQPQGIPTPQDNLAAVDVAGINDPDAFSAGRDTVLWSQQSHAAEGLLVYLGRKFGAAFVRSADIIGMPVVTEQSKRMDVTTSAAMCEDAGLSNTQKKIINQYSTYHLGHPLTAPESKIRALGQNAILPISGECVVNNERCPYWKKDPIEVFEKKIAEALEPHPSLEWDKLEIIMGGDHGQGAFCLPIKLLLKKDEKIKIEFENNLGEVECKKDTSEILRASFFPYLNERLKSIVKYERDNTNKITNDGYIYEFRKIGSAVSRFSFNGDAKEGEEVVRKRPLRLIVTGDLAFYAVILGMKNAAPFHCHLCLLKKTEWEKEPLKKGSARSMEWLLTNYHKAKVGKKQGRTCMWSNRKTPPRRN